VSETDPEPVDAPLHLDGSAGEGGGQILRSALSLSLVTGRPFRISSIRANRRNPGLRAQHLAAVRAARAVGGAEVTGAVLGSRELSFRPAGIRGGEHLFDVGTAGSTTLVLQTILPALLFAKEPAQVTIEGGTHNPWAPPFEFLERSFGQVLRRMGATFAIELERHGFAPAGGGILRARVTPGNVLRHLDLRERGEVRSLRVTALLSNLPLHIAEREIERVRKRIGVHLASEAILPVAGAAGPGNALLLEIETDAGVAVFSCIGRRGLRAEAVADDVAEQARAFLDSGAAVDAHLADQLLLPMALAGGGTFTTGEPSSHARTNAGVIEAFLKVRVNMERDEGGRYEVRVEGW